MAVRQYVERQLYFIVNFFKGVVMDGLSNIKPTSKMNTSIISATQRICDIFSILLGWIGIVTYFNAVVSNYFLFCVIILFQFVTGLNNVYMTWRGERLYTTLQRINLNFLFCFISCWFVVSISRNDFFSDVDVFIIWVVITFCFFFVFNLLIRYACGFMRKNGIRIKKVAIFGVSENSYRLFSHFSDYPWLGFSVYGFYNSMVVNGVSGKPIRYIGDENDLINDIDSGLVDHVYIATEYYNDDEIRSLLLKLSNTTSSVHYIPSAISYGLLQTTNTDIEGIPILPVHETSFNGMNMLLKRLMDILFSMMLIILFLPVMMIVFLSIKLTSSGPVIFKQKRYGLDGKEINILKFRTMYHSLIDKSLRQATIDDLRVTKVGRFLRRTSLDELPQLFNVLFGTMSLVGPRPHAIAHNEEFRKLIHGYMLRHKVKPGITGWAQICGWRGETDTLEKMKKRIEYDLFYINNWTLIFDIKILFLTVFYGLLNKNAY